MVLPGHKNHRLCVHLIFNFQKRWTDTGSEALKKDFAKGIAEKVIIKVFDRAPGSEVASTTFGNPSNANISR